MPGFVGIYAASLPSDRWVPVLAIRKIRFESTTERALSEDDDVIQTLAAKGTNEPFDIGPLPRRSRCGQHLFDAHGLHLISEVPPESRSRSRSRYGGALSQGKASRSCWAVHSAVAWTVTAKCTIRRRSCAHEKHIEDLESDLGTVKKSTDTIVFI